MNHQLETIDMELIGEQIRDFIRTNFLAGSDVPIDNGDSLIEHGIIDETGVLELVMFVEETYGIQVEETDLLPENFDTVASISAYVAERLADQTSGTQPVEDD